MRRDRSGQKLLIQLETALHRLVESFWEEPYRYFTEGDAVAALQTWVALRPELAQVVRTADGFETGLLHREYPTFFRFRRRDPIKRLSAPARRGYYGLALLDPAYVGQHGAETALNRDIGDRGDLSGPPLLAAVEFKLFARGWSPVRVRQLREELGKLELALQPPADASTAYLCILQRDVSAGSARWERYWPAIETMLAECSEIQAVVAVCWPQQKEKEPFVHYAGPWITGEAGRI